MRIHFESGAEPVYRIERIIGRSRAAVADAGERSFAAAKRAAN
jgi:hypothetical protein